MLAGGTGAFAAGGKLDVGRHAAMAPGRCGAMHARISHPHVHYATHDDLWVNPYDTDPADPSFAGA